MSNQTVLCHYNYDPLDRLATRTPLAEAMARRFYKAGQLAIELQGTEQRTLLRAASQLLAQKSQPASALLATDQQNSVLQATTPQQQTPVAYAPYGHRQDVVALPGLPGFKGEQPDPITGHYLLGNGYRAYNPVLMRFNSPDSLSPFGEGGLNVYAYCVGDPVNRSDPTGHFSGLPSVISKWLASAFRRGARAFQRTPAQRTPAFSNAGPVAAPTAPGSSPIPPVTMEPMTPQRTPNINTILTGSTSLSDRSAGSIIHNGISTSRLPQPMQQKVRSLEAAISITRQQNARVGEDIRKIGLSYDGNLIANTRPEYVHLSYNISAALRAARIRQTTFRVDRGIAFPDPSLPNENSIVRRWRRELY